MFRKGLTTIETLRYGSQGPAVALLQTALNRAGESAGTPDGFFGNRTQLAVMRFQSANGLTPDGIVGGKTHSRLMPFYTGYTQHTVARGATFYRLARRYGTTVSAIAAANPQINPTRLQNGQILVVQQGIADVTTDIPQINPNRLQIGQILWFRWALTSWRRISPSAARRRHCT